MKKAKGRCAGIVVFCCLLCTYGLLAVCPYACLPTGRRGGNEPSQKSKIENRKSKIDSLVPEAVQIIETALADTDPSIKDNAIEVVATTRQIGLMPKVGRLLNDEFVSVRFTAALAVGDTQYRFVRESVGQLLKDRDENVRIAAAYAMYRLGYPDNFRLRGATVASAEALGLIRKAIVSKDQDIRANAALILGKFNSSLGPRDPSLERRATCDEKRIKLCLMYAEATPPKRLCRPAHFAEAAAKAEREGGSKSKLGAGRYQLRPVKLLNRPMVRL